MSYKHQIKERLEYISTIDKPEETETAKCSFNLPKTLVHTIDYLAGELKTTRQDVVVGALVDSIREALEAYGEFHNYSADEFIDIQARISSGMETPYVGSKIHQRVLAESEKSAKKSKNNETGK